MNDRAALRVNAERLGDIRDVLSYLNVFAETYNHLYAFEMIVDAAKKKHEEINEGRYGWGEKSVKTLTTIRKPEEVVLPADRLWIQSVVVKSPGFWEFLGTVNPFEVLRKYLCDRHERKKDAAYRERQEEERGELELEKMRLEVVQEKIDLLKKVGVPEEKIRKALFTHVTEPLRRLDEVQDRGLILDAQIVHSQGDATGIENKES